MALTADHLPLRLPGLRFEARALAFDPTELADDGQTHGVFAYAKRCGDANAPIRRVSTKMQILDVLSNHPHRQAANRDLLCLSIHLGSSPTQRLSRLRRRHRRTLLEI